MNGMSCLACGKGWYNGYKSRFSTQPCKECGHVAPAKLPDRVLRVVIEVRDAALSVRKEKRL
jgi:hypothetical protein